LLQITQIFFHSEARTGGSVLQGEKCCSLMAQEGYHLCVMNLLITCLWHSFSKKHRKSLWFESLSVLRGHTRHGFQSPQAEDRNMSFLLP